MSASPPTPDDQEIHAAAGEFGASRPWEASLGEVAAFKWGVDWGVDWMLKHQSQAVGDGEEEKA